MLHVINGEHFSGAERVQQLLGKRLNQFGFDAQFACVKPGKFSSYCDLRSGQVSEVPMTGRFDMRVVKQLSTKVLAEDVDLLHAHTPRTALVTSLVSLRTGRPWVYHVHSPAARDSTRGFVNRINSWIERYAIRSCQQLITVSKSLRREMLRRGVPKSRLTVVPNGVPAIEPIATTERVASRQWRLGLIALMRPRKGVEVALEAMQQLRRQGHPVQLDLIGGFETEAYQQQTLDLIHARGLDDVVRWRGFTDDIPSAIRNLDALLLPSLFGEGMPMVVLEALSAAVPVVATRVEGTPEVIRDGIEGVLAQPGDAHSLTEKVVQLTSDRLTWQQMSQRALARHRNCFSDNQMASRVAKAYRKILGPKS